MRPRLSANRFLSPKVPGLVPHALPASGGALPPSTAFFLAWMMSFIIHGDTFSDTEQYRQWALLGYNPSDLGDAISPWVYPLLAQIPIFAANMFGPSLYLLGWTLIIIALNAVGLVFLTRGNRAAQRDCPGLVLAVFHHVHGLPQLCPGGGHHHLPGAHCAAVCGGTPRCCGRCCSSVATWIKVWPAAVVAPLLIASAKRVQVFLTGRGRQRRRCGVRLAHRRRLAPVRICHRTRASAACSWRPRSPPRGCG